MWTYKENLVELLSEKNPLIEYRQKLLSSSLSKIPLPIHPQVYIVEPVRTGYETVSHLMLGQERFVHAWSCKAGHCKR